MKANPRFGAGRKCQYRGEAGQKFHINDRVDADLACAQDCAQGAPGERDRTFCRDGDHILLRNDLHCVENEAIVLKYDEVDVLASDHSRRAADCRISEDGGPLLRELDKENPSDLARPRWTRRLKDSSDKRQDCAKRRTNPAIGALQSSNACREIHFLTLLRWSIVAKIFDSGKRWVRRGFMLENSRI